jgi:hypothetical protein
MTPPQAAKEHCANYQANGTCLGIAFRDDLTMYRFRTEGLPCLLCEGQRCSYFEEIVVPRRMSRETVEAKARADRKDAAVKTYLNSHNLISSKTSAKKMCRECRKVHVEGQKRLCAKCAQRRTRTSYRLSKRRSRSDVQKLANSPVGAEPLTKADWTGRYSYSASSNFTP